MGKPTMVNTIQRILNESEQNMIADAHAQETVAVASKASGMPAPPSAQIMSSVYQQQQYQANMQAMMAKNINKILQEKYYTPASALAAQRAELSMQEQQIKAEIKAKQRQAEFAAIAPRETVQNSETSNYITQDQLAMLEKIYIGLSPKKRINLYNLTPMTQYGQNLQHYQGGFVDPNYDKQMRPLGADTAKITEF